MKNFVIYTATAVMLASSAIAAETVSGKNVMSIEKEGFTEVGEILREMTPEQKKAVMEQAYKMMQELKNKTPEEIEAIKAQMHHMEGSLDMQKIDVKKIDPAKSKGLHGIEKDINKYLDNQEK